MEKDKDKDAMLTKAMSVSFQTKYRIEHDIGQQVFKHFFSIHNRSIAIVVKPILGDYVGNRHVRVHSATTQNGAHGGIMGEYSLTRSGRLIEGLVLG